MELRREVPTKHRWTASTVFAVTLATGVFLAHVGMFVFVAALLWMHSFAGVVLAVALSGLVVLVRPRLGRLPKTELLLRPEEAPHLYTAVSAVAGELGVMPPWRIAMSPHFNAELIQVGYRRRDVLVLGLPYWAMLEPAERAAAVAHCLGARASGDVSRTWIVDTALTSLSELCDVLDEPPVRPVLDDERSAWLPLDYWRPPVGAPRMLMSNAVTRILMKIMVAPARWSLRLLRRSLRGEATRVSRVREAFSVRVAGSDVAVGALSKLASREAAMNELRAMTLRQLADPLHELRFWFELLTDAQLGAILDDVDSGLRTRMERTIARMRRCQNLDPNRLRWADFGGTDHDLAPVVAPLRHRIHDWAVSGKAELILEA